MYLLWDQAPVANLVSDRVFLTRGALKPSDSLVDPIVVMRRIGLRFLSADRGLGYAVMAQRHQVSRFTSGANQASVTALSMMCR
jgi:hypothetical protein